MKNFERFLSGMCRKDVELACFEHQLSDRNGLLWFGFQDEQRGAHNLTDAVTGCRACCSGRVVGFSICTPPGAKVVISEKAIRQSPGGAYKKYDGNEADHYPEWVDVLRLC